MIIAVVGPTGSGKSALALLLARRLGGQIVNGDAFQVYKGLDIGTAKPSLAERAEITHHLYDFVSPSEDYNVNAYQTALRQAISELEKTGIPVILVGGTGLYIKAGLFDYRFEDEPPVDLSDLDKFDNQELYDYLGNIDPAEAAKLHPHNRRRVLRAIAIFRASGMKKSAIIESQDHKCLYDAIFVGLDIDRLTLYADINRRVDLMFERGLVEEVSGLVKKYGKQHHAFLAIGYKEVIEYLEGVRSLPETIELVKKNSRNYAKRQFTFFRNQLPVEWYPNAEEAYQTIVKKIGECHG